MSVLKIVLMDRDRAVVPDWVAGELAQAGYEFAARRCANTAALLEFAHDADVIWNWGSYHLTADSLANLPRLGAIIRTGSGTDNVPVEAATQRGIVVANMPEAHSDAVSDHAIALLFAVMRHIPMLDQSVRAGQWLQSVRLPQLWHLHGQTLGLVGFGHAAGLVAQKMRGFELRALAYDPFIAPEAIQAAGVQPASLDELLAASDIISLHCPLTPATRHLIAEAELRRMKPSAILVNTARGPVVDEAALVRALTEGWIAAAGLDVLEQEPPAPDNPLFGLKNVVLTPHIAGQSDEDLESCWRLSVDAAVALAEGRWPRSCVNRGLAPRFKLA